MPTRARTSTKTTKRGSASTSPLRKKAAPDVMKASVYEPIATKVSKADILRPTSGQSPPQDEADPTWQAVGALAPPYEPLVLMTLLENSNSLRQCIDAYVTNIDAFGHRFEPTIDLNAADADDLVKQYLVARAAVNNPKVVADPRAQLPDPPVDVIEAAKKELAERMAAEGHRLQQFFDHACLDISFVKLRRQTRQDLETIGNAYWECLRSADGKLAGFEYIPGFTVRHFGMDRDPVEVTYRVKENQFDYGTVTTRKRFRRYVQVYEAATIWFKEFGDPRTVSRHTGNYYKDIDDLVRAEKHENVATEIIAFRIHTSKTSYGVPRWVGALLSVLGSRQSEEVNLSYFENKTVPPLAITVTGGRISTGTVARIKDFIENDLKGKRNFHKILVLEGESGGANMSGLDSGRMKIDIKPLTDAQNKDALFQDYDERNIDKVGMAFRLSRMLRGDIRDFNRATGDAALDFSESQVFKPERDDFDFLMNRKILPELGIRFWKFVSNACTSQNVTDRATIINGAVTAGYVTPAEARDLFEGIINRPLRKIDAPWVTQPIVLTAAGIVPKDDLLAPGMVSPQVAATGASVAAPGTNGAPAQATDPGAAVVTPGISAGKGVTLTGTDAASVVTVNEARADMGKGPLMLPPDKGGGQDPDGFLTVAEFKAKRMSLGQTQGVVEGGGKVGAPDAAPSAQKRLQETILALTEMQKAADVVERERAKAEFDGQMDGGATGPNFDS